MWYRDYAGGGNVHAVGGMAALVGAIFIGPRIGRFEKVQFLTFFFQEHFGQLRSKKSISFRNLKVVLE